MERNDSDEKSAGEEPLSLLPSHLIEEFLETTARPID
jgi:hypothetical protein